MTQFQSSRGSIADTLLTPPPITDAQAMAKRSYDAAHASSLLDGIDSSFAWVRDRTVKAWESTFYDDPNDPSFRLNPKLLDELTSGLPETMWDRFSEARSLQQAYAIKAHAQRDAENLGIIQNSWGGQAWIPMVAANVLDPTMLLAATVAGPIAGGIQKVAGLTEGIGAVISSGVVVGGTMAGVETFYKSGDSSINNWDIASAGLGGFGLGAGLKGAATASRTARALTAGAGAAAGTVTVESARAIVERDRSVKDIIYAGLNQLAFGAFFGFAHGTSPDPKLDTSIKTAAENAQKSMVAQSLADNGAGLTENGRKILAPVTTKGYYNSVTGELVSGLDDVPLTTGDIAQHMLTADQATMQIAAEMIDMPPVPRLFTATEEQLFGGPDQFHRIHVVNESDLGVRVRSDGIVEVGRMFAKADPEARRAMLEFEFIKPLAMAELLRVEPKSEQQGIAAIQAKFDLANWADAKAVYDGIKKDVVPKKRISFNGTSAILSPSSAPIPTLGPHPNGPLLSIGAASPAELATIDATAKAKAELDASRTPGDLNLGNVTDARSWGWSLGDMASLVGKSIVSPFRRASAMLSRDLLPRVDEAGRIVPTVESAAERARRVIQVNEAELAGKFNAAFDSWRKSKPELPDGVSAWDHFNDLVGRATMGIKSDDPNVNSAADFGRTLADRQLKMNQRYGDRAFDGVEPDANYFPLHAMLKKVNNAIGKFGEQNVYRLMGEAFRKMFPELSEELARIWGEGYVRNVRINRLGLTELEHYFSGRDTEAAIVAMREAGIKITDPQAQEFLDTIKWTKPEAGTSPRAMRARGFDRTFSLPMVDVNGETSTLSVADLIDTHAARVWQNYNRHMVGRAVMAEVYRSTDPTGKIATFNDYLNHLRLEGDKAIETNPTAKDSINNDFQRLSVMARSVLQVPLRDKQIGADTLRMLRSLQYVRVLGSHFAAHLGNLGHLLTVKGINNMLAHMDSFHDLWRNARDGQFNSKIVRESVALAADGQEPLRMSVASHFDTLSPWDDPTSPNSPTTPYGRIVASATGVLEKGKRFQDTGSFFNRTNTFIQRASAIMAEQRLFDDAKQFVNSGRLPSARRLAAIGFTPEDAPAFFRAIYEHADTETSWNGVEKIVQTNPGAWPDQNLAARYINALDKTTRRWAQRGDVGDMAMWMTGDIGKTLIQFRQYHYVAYRNQMLFGLRMNDLEAWSSFARTAFVGGLAYMGLTYARSVGKPDDEKAKFLAQSLTPAKIGLAAFQRSSFSSIFPMFADAGGTYTGLYEPPFHGIRTSGLANDPIFGNPTIDFFDTGLHKVLPAAIGSLRTDKQFTRENMHDLKSMLPFSRMLGISNILDQLGKQLPWKPEQE